MVQEIFRFIEDKFSAMPKKVQVVTYLTFLALFAYLITLPSFLDMKLVAIKGGEEFPIRDAEVQVEVSGRAIRLLTDENGRFSVPMSTTLPTSNILFVLNPNPNNNSIKEIEVPVTNSYISRSKLIFDKATTTYKIVPDGIGSSIGNMFANISVLSSAFAGEANNISYSQAKETTLNLISNILGKEMGSISPDDKLHTDLNLDNVDLSYLNSKIKKQYGLDTWQTLKNPDSTVLQLIEAISGQGGNTSISPDHNGLIENLERRKKVFSFSEKNTHCQPARSISLPVRADSEWKIDATTIQSNIMVSAQSNFTGIRNQSPEGFIVTGKVINNGDCIKILGSNVAKDGRGHIWGSIVYEEYRKIEKTSEESSSIPITEKKSFSEVPVEYGDISALQQYEELWKKKLENSGNSNAEAKAHLIAVQLAEIVWSRKRVVLEVDQRMVNLRSMINSLNADEKKKAEAQIWSLQSNIIAQTKSRDYQLEALFGKDLRVNNPVDTQHEVNFLTNYSVSSRQKWYNQARLRFSQLF